MLIIKRFASLYKNRLEIMLPLIVINLVILPFINSIPYVNLYAKEFVLVLLLLDWLILLLLVNVSLRGVVKILMLLFAITYILHILKFGFYAESIANIIYLILIIELIRELRRSMLETKK